MQAKTLDIYLDDGLCGSAERGEHNYFNQVRNAFEARGFAVSYRPNDRVERIASAARPGYALFHMDPPDHPRALTTRRAYYYPFWRIESSAKRWEWQVAQTPFQPSRVDGEAANPFFGQWRKRLFGAAAAKAARTGFVYLPLQGRLTEHRSFQTMSPLDMIEAVLEAEPNRNIRATLHPKETYSAGERRALDRLVARHARLTLSDAPMEELLGGSDYVVTQNSAAALAGFFYRKPAVLFGQSDFHHIAETVAALGVTEAIARADDPNRPYARYIYWFLQLQSINAGRPDAPERILRTVRARGWEV